MPYTYTVDYDDDTPVTEMTSSADPLSLNHTFATTGTYTVELAAWSCTLAGPVTDSLKIEVTESGGGFQLYLPLVLRNHPPTQQ